MKKNKQKNKKNQPKCETAEYENVTHYYDQPASSQTYWNTNEQIKEMNELFKKSLSSLGQIKTKIDKLEQYSSKMGIQHHNDHICPFYYHMENHVSPPLNNNINEYAYYHGENKPQTTHLSFRKFMNLDKNSVEIQSEPSVNLKKNNEKQKLVIDLNNAAVNQENKTTFKHSQLHNKHHHKVHPDNTYSNHQPLNKHKKATFYTTNIHNFNETYPNHTNVKYYQPNTNFESDYYTISQKQPKDKTTSLNCCKKRKKEQRQ